MKVTFLLSFLTLASLGLLPQQHHFRSTFQSSRTSKIIKSFTYFSITEASTCCGGRSRNVKWLPSFTPVTWRVPVCEQLMIMWSMFCRCAVSDTAEYSAVATNSHGMATSKATVIVKSKKLFFLLCHSDVFESEWSALSQFSVSHRSVRSRSVLPSWIRWVRGGGAYLNIFCSLESGTEASSSASSYK